MVITLTTIVVAAAGVMLGIISFFLIRLVTSIDRMADDLGVIKVSVKEIATKHENLENEIENVKEDVRELKVKVYI
jgi:hypothetical protein